ncbi:MAG: oligosaccharide flippase family protein [bacterium]
MDESLRDKAISGAKWQALATYANQAVQAAGAIVLPWLVVREDYGVVAAGMVALSLVRAGGTLGVNYALIHRQDRIQEATNTAFVLMLVIGAVSYGLLAALSPLAAAYFEDGRLTVLIPVLGLLFFLRPAAIVTQGTLTRDFRFRRLFVVDFVAVVLSTGAAIALAALLPKAHRFWALAVAGLGREAMRSVAAWCLAVVRPRLAFDWALAKELLQYGKFFVATALVLVLYNNLERLALGGLLSTAALGLYVFAYKWVFRVGDVSETIFGGVSVPVYAKLQDDVPRLRTSFIRIVRLSALLSTGLLVGLVLLVPEALPLIFPSEWWASAPIFQVLGLWYIVRAVDTTTGQLYAAVGKPKYNTLLTVINVVVVAATVVPFIRWWGAVGAAWSLFAARVISVGVNARICSRVLRCPARRLVDVVTPALKAATAMAVVLAAAQVLGMGWVVDRHPAWIGGPYEWVALVTLIALGAAAYVATLYVFERALFREMVGLVRDALRGRKVRLHGTES